MYGGMGGMYGGMGGMGGMYGGMGGMYGRGMYGQGMNDPNMSFMEKMNMYVMQVCEIAQMVECYAPGLGAFVELLQKISSYLATEGKKWLIWFVLTVKEKVLGFFSYIK